MSSLDLQNRMKYVPVFNYFICGYYLFKGYAAGDIPGKELVKFAFMAILSVILESVLVVLIHLTFRNETVNYYTRIISIYGFFYVNAFYAIRIQKKYGVL